MAITYGDPAFYGRVGFTALAETQARAPLPLSLPQGWLGQSLQGRARQALRGPSRCVPALNRADIWQGRKTLPPLPPAPFPLAPFRPLS